MSVKSVFGGQKMFYFSIRKSRLNNKKFRTGRNERENRRLLDFRIESVTAASAPWIDLAAWCAATGLARGTCWSPENCRVWQGATIVKTRPPGRLLQGRRASATPPHPARRTPLKRKDPCTAANDAVSNFISAQTSVKPENR